MRRRDAIAAGAAALIPMLGGSCSRPAATPASRARTAEFGSLLNDGDLTDPARRARYAEQCRRLTVAGPLYARFTQPTRGAFSLEAARARVRPFMRADVTIRGHTLLWHQLEPQWMAALSNPSDMRTALSAHVEGVVGGMRGLVHEWDVVNEPLDERGDRADGLRASRWLRALGPDFIVEALGAVRRADPDARVGINENRLDGDDSSSGRRRDAMLKLLERLAAAGQAPDYLGIQGHLDPDQRYSREGVGTFVRRVRDLGLSVHITELDVSDVTLPSDTSTRDRNVADVYARYLDVILAEEAVSSVSTWGLFDDTSWLQDTSPRADGQPQRPLPFDSRGAPKAAWRVLSDRLQVGHA